MIFLENDLVAPVAKQQSAPESGPKGKWVYFVLDGTVVHYLPMSVEWGNKFLNNPLFTSRIDDDGEIVEMHVDGEVFDLKLSEMFTSILLSEPEIVFLPFWKEDGSDDMGYAYVGPDFKWDGNSFYYDKTMPDGSVKRFFPGENPYI
jgi:hypothetical protein